MKFKAQITLAPFFDGGSMRLSRTCLESGEWDTPEEARDYAELLINNLMAIAYRVVYKPEGSNTWYNHEYVKYLEEETVKRTTYIKSGS